MSFPRSSVPPFTRVRSPDAPLPEGGSIPLPGTTSPPAGPTAASADTTPAASATPSGSSPRPVRLDLDRMQGLTITWTDGICTFYPVAHLRRHSPSADARALRQEMQRNPLTVLPSGKGTAGPLHATSMELVGNYAIRIRFSDGHETGIYSWAYLRSITP